MKSILMMLKHKNHFSNQSSSRKLFITFKNIFARQTQKQKNEKNNCNFSDPFFVTIQF